MVRNSEQVLQLLYARGTGLSNVSHAQVVTRVSLHELASTYEGVQFLAESYERTIAAAAATQQPDLCAGIFEMFLRACERNGWESARPAMLKALVRTCDVGTILEDSLGIISKPEQRSALITGLLAASAKVGSAGWAVATLAKAASMPCPSGLADAVSRVQACVDLLDTSPSSSSSVPSCDDVAAAAAPVLRTLLFAPSGDPNLELLRGLPSTTRDALVRTLLSTGSRAASLALLRPLALDLSPSQREAEQLLSDCHLLSTSPHLLLKMASLPPAAGWPGWGRSLLTALQQVPFEQRGSALAAGGESVLAQLLLHDTGRHQHPQLLVSFLEEHMATGVASSPGAAVDDSSGGGISAAPLASMQMADWRRLVSGMLDLCKGDQGITHATTRVAEMALAASARPQAGGNVEARLVAETRWVIMEAMFAPTKLRHAAAVGVARDLLMRLQSRGWYLHASASLVQGLGCERSLHRNEAVAVRESLQPCIADLCAWLAQLGGRWANIMCSQAGGDAAQALLFAAEACHKHCDEPLVDLLRAHLSSVSKEVPARLAELVMEAVADLEVFHLGIEPATAARALVEVAELLPMCAANGDLHTTQPLVLAAYSEAAVLAASLAAATRCDGSGVAPLPLHLDPRQLYEAAARSVGVDVPGSISGATSVWPSWSTVLDLLAVCDAAQLPLEAVHLALSVLDVKLPLGRSSSSSSGGGGAEPALPLDEQSVAAEAMAIANGAYFFRGSLTVFLALLRRRGTSGVDSAGAMQMVLDAVNNPSASEDDQRRLLSELTDAVRDDGYIIMEEAAAGGLSGSVVVAEGDWLASMRGHQWPLPSSWAVPAAAESRALAPEHLPDSSASGDDDGSDVSSSAGVERVAYYGGREMTDVDRQLMERLHPGSAIVWCESDNTGGRAPAQGLCKSIRRGAYNRVYIDTR
ncbi:hypothetical protein FOA52_010664 [Chlamydomonas sp. UWO 241]|nr:hypothetical protein FOA52_010664 [Chlamydomonas sp. UWO 241]